MSAPDLENEVLKAGLITKKSYSKDEQQLLVSAKNYVDAADDSITELIETRPQVYVITSEFSYTSWIEGQIDQPRYGTELIPANSLILSAVVNVTEAIADNDSDTSSLSIGLDQPDNLHADTVLTGYDLGGNLGISPTLLATASYINATLTVEGDATALTAGEFSVTVAYISY